MKRWGPALGGIAAVLCAAGVGEAMAALTGAASPIGAVGDAIIDVTPAGLKEFVIGLFGTADKLVLVILVCLVMLLLAAAAGIWEARRPPVGRAVVGVVSLAGAWIVITRPGATVTDLVPTIAAGVIAVVLLGVFVRLARRASDEPGSAATEDEGGVSRRRFLTVTAGAGALGMIVGLGSLAIRASSTAARVVRQAVQLPKAAKSAPPVPASASLDVPGISPVITPTADFYRIDTALVVPQLDATDWTLRIHGLVAQEIKLTWEELLALPMEESTTTLMCVSNAVGGDLIGNAAWLGYPIRHLLAKAQPQPGADMVLSTSADGWTASSPLEALTDDRNSILAIGMNGKPLPPEHGFPVRMVVPGLYGYVSATKWVVDLEVTRFADKQAYWTTNGWSERGPIKLSSRIDVPRPRTPVAAGETMIAGVAWQQHTGIKGVEVQVDDGPWQPANLATAISSDTWVQWSLPWTAAKGSHVVRCRATSAGGEVQTSEQRPVAPDGATGWHEVTVQVN